jgi:hypothetical protein
MGIVTVKEFEGEPRPMIRVCGVNAKSLKVLYYFGPWKALPTRTGVAHEVDN